MNDRFLQTSKLYQVVDFEAYLFITFLGIVAYLFYAFLLKNVNKERHLNLQSQHKSLFYYLFILTLFYGFFWFTQQQANDSNFKILMPYLGLISYLIGAFCFIRISHLLVLQYLFLSSMQAGVPLLIVNIFSLILSIIIVFWTVNNLFGVMLAPLLATSAAFSIILGLALQDTLGNLFAGISLQLDKTFEIGSWLEINNGSNKIVGQVKELSWRSTLLVGFSDELITLPNKLVAACQVSNFSPENTPILRSQTFRFHHTINIKQITELLELSASKISEVRAQPAPLAFVVETNETAIVIKLIYFLDNYGRQFAVGDKVVTAAMETFTKNNIQLAKPALELYKV